MDISREMREFFERKRYSRAVINGGIEYLLQRWTWICEQIPYRPRYLVDEFKNDVMVRQIIDTALLNFTIDEKVKNRIYDLDKVFMSKTVPIDCIFGEETKRERHYSPEREWYYFRMPPSRIPDWLSKDA